MAAADPDNAWFPVARTAEEIIRPEPANRMVATPYTKLMTAVMDVDMAAAVLLATEARADQLGVPADRRVYLWGTGVGRGAGDHGVPSRPLAGAGAGLGGAARPWGASGSTTWPTSTCTRASPRRSGSPVTPSGITDDRALTVTGGLPYHGGPGSNYATHALVAMAETLRGRPGVPRTGHRGRDAHDQPRGRLWSTTPPPAAPARPVAGPGTAAAPCR